MNWGGDLKRRVKQLRSKGYTYSEICKKLRKKIPKSTLSFWCHGVKLPNFYAQKITNLNLSNAEKGRQIALVVNKLKRKQFLDGLKNKNLHLIRNLDQRDKKLLLAVFYLAEGSKHPSTQHLRFASISPDIIKFFLFLLKEVFVLDKSKFRVQILCRADQNLDKLINYWQKITNIDRKLIYKPRVDKRTIGKKTRKKNYRGVCVIDYFDTSIQLELQLLGKSLIKEYISFD